MSDENPKHAGDDFEEDYFDIASWDVHAKEWTPCGYEYTNLEVVGAVLQTKRKLHPNRKIRAIHVRKVVSYQDITSLAEYADSEAMKSDA